MNWGEFKKAVEDKGVKDTDEIAWIDVHMPESVDVTIDTEDGETSFKVE